MKGYAPAGTSGLLLAAMLAATPHALAASDAASTSAAERRSDAAPSAAEFSGPREAWHRLGTALRKGDRAGAMNELTPSAQDRYAALLDDWIRMKPFDENRFGKVKAVTLSGGQYATVKLTRKKNGATYGSEVMMMRGHDGKWRIDRIPTDDAVGH
jgi:hypothetical protein